MLYQYNLHKPISEATNFNIWGLHPVVSITITSFRGAVNRNNFYFLILLFTSLHVSASRGHPQVKHIVIFRSYYTYNRSIFSLYSLLFHIMLCNKCLKFEVKIADNVLQIPILYKN
jgi:hypothetical protein